MSKELVLINPSDYGLEEKTVTGLMGNVTELIENRKLISEKYDKVVSLDVDDSNTAVLAKEVRLLYVKDRTQGINKWHESNKEVFLRGSQFCDSVKRNYSDFNYEREAKLSSIEKNAENKEKERIEKIGEARKKELLKYVDNIDIPNIAELDDSIWNPYLESKKEEFEAKVAAKLKAEKERIEKEKADKLEQEKIRLENERLKKEAQEREEKQKIEAEKRAKDEAKAQKEREDKAAKEKAIHDAELEKQRKAQKEIEDKAAAKQKALEEEIQRQNDVLAKEKAAKIIREQQAKQEKQRLADIEQKRIDDEEKRVQLELSKGDEEKLDGLINDIMTLKTKYTFKSNSNQKKLRDVCMLFDKVVDHINK